MEKEIWKDVPGYDGLYKVSSLGRVKSFKWGREKILRANTQGNFLNVLLSKNSKGRTVMIHVLVAEAFLGKKLYDDRVINHIDGDRTNNRLSNLQCADRKSLMDERRKKQLREYSSKLYRFVRYKDNENFEVFQSLNDCIRKLKINSKVIKKLFNKNLTDKEGYYWMKIGI